MENGYQIRLEEIGQASYGYGVAHAILTSKYTGARAV